MRAGRWLALFGLWAGCTWLVDPDGEAARCEVTEASPNPCADGYTCRDERCVPVTSNGGCGTEICGNERDDDCDDKVDEFIPGALDKCGDKEDNDCDGKVDETPNPAEAELCGNHTDDDCDGQVDEGHDQDMDGNEWCGDISSTNGGRTADCDDYDPTVYSGATEVCDGVDNNCDRTIDEPGSLCPEGQECVAQRCVTPSCAVEGSSAECSETQMCDLTTGRCVARTCSDETCMAADPNSYCDRTSGECRTVKRANGEECAAHDDCLSGSCVDAAALRLVTSATRVCGKSCCGDEQCVNEGERCFSAGSGARSCLPAAQVPEPPGAAEHCTIDSQCAMNEACAVVPGQDLLGPGTTPRDDLIAPVGAAVTGADGTVGDPCDDNLQCASQACVGSNDLFVPGRCSRVCRTTADCSALARFGVSTTGAYCRYLGASTATTDGDYVPVCVIDRGEIGVGDFGDTCSSGRDCIDGACVTAARGEPGYCAPACCNDSQCPALGGAATHCRPIAFGDHYEMRCVR